VTNYYLGRNPSDWHAGVPNYGGVRYGNVYPGIDLVYYGNQYRLEYDFLVAPGADPRRISLDIGGADKLKVEAIRHHPVVEITPSGGRELFPRVSKSRLPSAPPTSHCKPVVSFDFWPPAGC
jgi:hypothetical protein